MENTFEKRKKGKVKENYNRKLINTLDEYLLDYSKILELGSGDGANLAKLSKNYRVVGSDLSRKNVQAIRQRHPEIHVKLLDIHEMKIEEDYDCIYSDKVLTHLTKEELKESIKKQGEHLKDEGIILMTLNYGEYCQEEGQDGYLSVYYTEYDIHDLVPKTLQIDLIDSYIDENKNNKKDSLLVILKKR